MIKLEGNIYIAKVQKNSENKQRFRHYFYHKVKRKGTTHNQSVVFKKKTSSTAVTFTLHNVTLCVCVANNNNKNTK